MDETGGSRTGGAWVLMAIFLLGIVAGASILYLGQRSGGGFGKKPPPRIHGDGPRDAGPKPLHPLDRMAHELDLSPEQEEAIRLLLEEHRGELEALLESSRLAIREVLTEEQREAFDRMRPPGPRGRPGMRPPPPPGRRPPLGSGGQPPPHPPRD